MIITDKLLFIDIDGTLAHDNGIISKSTKRVLKKYKNIVFVTGRSRNDVKKLCDELNLRYFISSYGTEIYDNFENKVLFNITLNPQTVLKISKLGLNNNLELVVAIDNQNIVITNENYMNVTKNVKQYMLKGTINNLNNMRKELKNIKGIKYQRDNAYEYGYHWFSIMPSKANKGNAATHLMEYLNIKKENTISFGNDINDIPLFNNTGHKIAVGNSCEELKREAAIIIGDNNKDSVKKYIESIS
ncbi:MAG: HAD family hydrolase [Bacilli bacterium]